MSQSLSSQEKKAVAKLVIKRLVGGWGIFIVLIGGFYLLSLWKLERDIKKSGILQLDKNEVHLPPGIPPYKNAEPEIASSFLHLYNYTSTDDVKTITDFYQKYYKNNGFKVVVSQKPATTENPGLIDLQVVARKGDENYSVEVWNTGVNPTHIIYSEIAPESPSPTK